jgi:glycosyltransferase involved in cell wall biosynthesis
VVFVGSYHGRKRGSLISNAVEELRSGTGLPIRLVVVGPRDDAVNWPEEVDHRSGLSDQEVRELISASWVLVAPSEYEGFGIPVYEALALGTPAITTHTPGSDFLSSQLNGAEGLIFTDEFGLKASLVRVLERGPIDHDAIPARQVDPLLRLGSSERLVNELYPEARRRFRHEEARPVQ